MEGFHAAYQRGNLVQPPELYLDLILVPALLHIDPLLFMDYPPAIRVAIHTLVQYYMAGGQGLNPMVIRHE